MTRQTVVGINKDTHEIVPIGKVEHTGLKCNCVCYNCENVLEAVLNTPTPTRPYFRHSNKSNCNPSPETELHLLAKTIILNNSRIYIPERGWTDYCNPVCEVRYNELIPDATIQIDGFSYYIEVVVTNGINKQKREQYQQNNSPVLVIDFKEEDRDLEYAVLEYLVLEEPSNRHVLAYPDISGNCGHDKWLIAGLTCVAGILITLISWNTRSKKNNSEKNRY